MKEISMDFAKQLYEKDFCLRLRKISRLISRIYDKKMKNIGINISQLNMLLSIFTNPGANLSEISKSVLMDRSTLTRNFRLLKRDELIIELPIGTDRRCIRYEVTKRGRKAMEKAFLIVERCQKEIDIKDILTLLDMNILKL